MQITGRVSGRSRNAAAIYGRTEPDALARTSEKWLRTTYGVLKRRNAKAEKIEKSCRFESLLGAFVGELMES